MDDDIKGMVELESRNRGRRALKRLQERLRKRMEEKRREKQWRRDIYKKELRLQEPKFIRKRAISKLEQKYNKKRMVWGSGWSIPQAGQRSVGQNIFDALAGTPAPQPKKRKR